eukprot:6775889-Alexandrium_andersonii.AAC.1
MRVLTVLGGGSVSACPATMQGQGSVLRSCVARRVLTSKSGSQPAPEPAPEQSRGKAERARGKAERA